MDQKDSRSRGLSDKMRHATFDPSTAIGERATSLAEILGAFSYALDLTEGQPEGHALRSCWIAGQLANALNLSATSRRTVYYATLLKDLGCSSNAARICELYQGDDRALKHDFKIVPQGLRATLGFVLTKTAKGMPLGARAKAIGNILRNGETLMTEIIRTRCTRGADIARLLRFPEEVACAIAALDEHWDGSGKPLGMRGPAIPLPSRLALLAQIVDVFHTVGGRQAAMEEVLSRSGTWFEPALVKVFTSLARSDRFWQRLAADGMDERVQALEPAEGRLEVDDDYLDDIAAAFGAVIDAKSPYTGGHSERVGLYAEAVGRQLGMGSSELRCLKRAAVLHDVGKLAVSSRILEKPGKLDDDEWVVMRSHASHTMTILSRITPLRDMAAIAGAHHERLDGKGYPLGLDQTMIAREARAITVADFYDALTADRPYRAAMPPKRALAIMEAEVGKAIDADCFAAIQSIALVEATTPAAGAARP